MKNKKGILIVLAMCAVVGIVVGVSNALPPEDAKMLLVGIAVVVLILWMVAKMLGMVRLSKQMNAPMGLLYEEKLPDQYVEEMEKILEKVSTKQQKDLVRINISAGQMYNGEYQAALDTMEKIALPGQPVVNQVLYYANQAMTYYLMGDKEKCVALVEEQRELFEKYQDTTSGLTNNVLVVFGIEKILQGKYGEAHSVLRKLENRTVSSILQDVVDYLLCECYRNEKEDAKRAGLKDEMSKRRVVPAIKNII